MTRTTTATNHRRPGPQPRPASRRSHGICRGCRSPRTITVAADGRYATASHRRRPPRWLRWLRAGEWWPCPGVGRPPAWVPDTVYTTDPRRVDNDPDVIGVYDAYAWRGNRGGHYPTHDA